MLNKKKILIGVTGSVALYKTIALIRTLVDFYEIRVVMTPSASAFIRPLMFQTVSKNKVFVDLFAAESEGAMDHIALARWADLMLIMPATANFMTKMVQGSADDLLSTLYLACSTQVVVVPAMNQQMWAHPATQRNIKQLQQDQVEIWGPESGQQACGDIGLGRMLDIELINTLIKGYFFEKKLQGVKVLVTAGPTREAIDPVRYLSNRSSGKMGYALVQALIFMGAKVTLVSGPVHIQAPLGINLIKVESAKEMYQAVMSKIKSQAIFIGCAAVADYHITNQAHQKIKKSKENKSLKLKLNKDILATVASLDENIFTLGFAAETERLEQYATDKMRHKKLDMIAANQVGGKKGGFEASENALTVLWKNGVKKLPLCDKNTLAIQLIEILAEQFYAKNASQNIR